LPIENETTIAGVKLPELTRLDFSLKNIAGLDATFLFGALRFPNCGISRMRFFGGLSVEETAEVLEVSPQTVMRDWKLAKAWLYQEMRS